MANPLDFTQNATVLVVDDAVDHLALIASLLKNTYKVQVANSGEKAIRIAQGQRPPDLILLDVMMPGLSGYEICKILKADSASKDIPIIFLTAMTSVVNEKLGLELGAVDFITKPVSPEILRARVAKQLQGKADADFLVNGQHGADGLGRGSSLSFAPREVVAMASASSYPEDILNLQGKRALTVDENGAAASSTPQASVLQTPPSRTSKPNDQETEEGYAELKHLAGSSILLVDDNELNQRVAYELLCDAGFVVDIAADGQKAVNSVEARALESRPFDLVLMDMQMPLMDGITATREIRRNHPSQELPIIAMTSNALQADRERCLTAGMDDFVTKPIEPEVLWKTLARWIKTRPGIGQTNTKSSAPAQDATKINPDTPKLPERIKGLDLQRGLMFVGDNEDRYLQTLGTFIGTQAQAISRIRLSLDRADLVDAERQAHTIKGQSGYLGAQDLQKSAGDLEALLNAAQKSTMNQTMRPDDIERALQEVAKHLDTLLQSVGQAFPQGLAPGKNELTTASSRIGT